MKGTQGKGWSEFLKESTILETWETTGLGLKVLNLDSLPQH